MRATRWTPWGIALLAVAPLPAYGQLQDSVSRVGTALAGLRYHSHIRVYTQTLGWVEGSVQISSSSVLNMLQEPGDTLRVFRAPQISSVFVRHSHAGRGALIGGAITGVGLGALSAVYGNSTGDVFGAAFVGMLPGILLGAIIGETSREWSQVAP